MSMRDSRFGMFTQEGENLAKAVEKAKLDFELQLAIVAWVGRVEGALYSLRRSGLLKMAGDVDELGGE